MKNLLFAACLLPCVGMSAATLDIYTTDGSHFRINKLTHKQVDDFINNMERRCQNSRPMFRIEGCYIMVDKISHFVVRGRQKHPEDMSVFTFFKEGK